MTTEFDAKFLRAAVLSITPLDRYTLEKKDSERTIFNLGCADLEMVTGRPLAHIKAAIARIVSESEHQQYLIPDHLCHFIENNWRVGNAAARDKWAARLQYPTDCAHRCLAKFYRYLEQEESAEGK